MRRLILSAIIVSPSAAFAHAGEAHGNWWTLDPWVWLPMTVAVILYVRGMALLGAKRNAVAAGRPLAVTGFATGMAAVFLALIWPLDALGAVSFAAHMAQHMLLIAVAAPLLVLAQPSIPLMLALPRRWRRGLTAARARLNRLLRVLLVPGVAFSVHGAFIWLWHAPRLYELALRYEWVHVLEHVTFFGSALLFWTSLARLGKRGGQDYGAGAVWCLATLIHTGMLGALLTFAPRLMYQSYVGNDNLLLTPLEDQQLAGLVMWIPAGMCYLVAGLAFAAVWLRQAERVAGEGRPNRRPSG